MTMSGYEMIKRNVKFEDPERIGLRFTSLGVGDVFRIYTQKPRAIRQSCEEPCMTKKTRTIPGTVDEWGCKWESNEEVKDGGTKNSDLGQPTTFPIVDWEKDYADYKVPDPYAEGRFDGLEEALSRPEAQGKWIQLNSPYCIFERLHFLRGFENTLMDLYIYKDQIEDLIDKLTDYQIGIVRQAAELGKGRIHCFDTTDDWGTQTGLMISPDMWRELFKPRYKRLIDEIHKAGMVIRFHTDGKVNDILEDFVEIGVDIVNIHQPQLLGIKEVGEKFAGRICFEAAVDIQDTLPKGDKGLIEQEVKDLIKYWATPHGGLIGVEYRYLSVIGAKQEDLEFAYECFKKYGNLEEKR
ncbi:uroporphyrinogen decarboxylase family protein [Haloimpatiens sp. FM7330]|uniref:uroporphyrinogen decarboxylase family protein n=1 Tax=Haloimpatiens sp. FM7330 TaxID=3298610 RepID=UPI00363AF55B